MDVDGSDFKMNNKYMVIDEWLIKLEREDGDKD